MLFNFHQLLHFNPHLSATSASQKKSVCFLEGKKTSSWWGNPFFSETFPGITHFPAIFPAIFPAFLVLEDLTREDSPAISPGSPRPGCRRPPPGTVDAAENAGK